MKKLYKIRITGRVQGVWFRKNTKLQAIGFGVTGFVQNEKDGSVYIEAEGTDVDLKKLVAWCLKGPERAMVDRVDVDEAECVGYSRFEIR